MLPLSITLPVGAGIIIAALSLLDQPTAALFLGVYAIAYINYDLLHYMTHRPWAPVPWLGSVIICCIITGLTTPIMVCRQPFGTDFSGPTANKG